MKQPLWRAIRWIPTVALCALGLLAATTWRHGGPHGCPYFLMSDVDSVEQVGRSWLPPSVDCRFTFQTESWLEHQPAWEFFLPLSFFVGAGVCARYAAKHPTADVRPGRRPWWRQLGGVVSYWFIVLATAAGLLAMAWRDGGLIGALPLVTIPLLSVWTLQWAWRMATWSSINSPQPSGGLQVMGALPK